MRSARKEPNQRVYKASPEKTSGRGSAPARHAAKHAKKRSLFGRAKQENSVPETAAPAPQPEVAEEEHTYTAPAAPPSAIPPVEPVLTPPAPPKSVKRKLNVLQPTSRPEAAAPQSVEQDDSAAALNTTGAAVPEGDESAEKAAPAEKKSSRSKRGSRREERESVLTSFQRFLDTLSIRLLCEVFLRQVRRLFVVGVVCTLTFMCVLTTVKSFSATTTMSLNYEESVTGKTPNGARFSESEFLTQEYLEAILQATGLQDDLTTSELADCISISPTNSKLVTKEDDYYISSSYHIGLKLPWSLWGKITVQDLLDQICRVYLKHFTADYRINAASLDISFDYSDMDYEEIGSYFQMMIGRINNYLTVRNDQAGSYLSTSGQSYSAIKKQVQNLQSYTLSEYQSYIWENGVAKNNARCIDDLNELNRTLRWGEMSDSQKSDIFMDILDNYNNKMVSSVLIPTYDSDGSFYMSRTKVGIDDLALRANELLSSAVDAQKTITTNNSKITALEQPTEAQELQVAQSMVDVITQQLASIVSATRELDADCYAQRISRYLVFNGPESSFIKRYNIKPSVMLAALICTVWYLAAVVKMSCQRQRERLQAENE